MALQCPKCNEYSLKITDKMNLPPDSHSDEIIIQIINCDNCDFEGIAIYEEFRRGSLDDESYIHVGYELTKTTLIKTKNAIQKSRKYNVIIPKYFKIYDENKR
jgi:C4-type Zn-finger protein